MWRSARHAGGSVGGRGRYLCPFCDDSDANVAYLSLDSTVGPSARMTKWLQSSYLIESVEQAMSELQHGVPILVEEASSGHLERCTVISREKPRAHYCSVRVQPREASSGERVISVPQNRVRIITSEI